MAKKNRNAESETDDNGVATAPPVPKKERRKATPEEIEARRDFLKVAAAGGIGLCAIGTPLCAAGRLILAPACREASQKGPINQFYPIAKVDELTEVPRLFDIVVNKRDAWRSTQKNGSLFLRKIEDRVVALHSLCPRVGCPLQVGMKKNPRTGNDEVLFYCSCHGARFDLDGHRLDNVAPRDLDTLDHRIENGVVFVKFEDFAFGIAEKR